LNQVNLKLDAGESLALTGESGSGKSTLLHLVSGLDAPDSGEIIFDGRNLVTLNDSERARLRRDLVGIVFQQFNLIPSLDVSSNLAFQARLGGRFDAGWITYVTKRLGLSDLLGRYPEQLSGGQQQRVAIGRTLAARPKLILADEPTGNLDEASGDTALDLMLALMQESRAALLLVTHSSRLAGKLSRRVQLRNGILS
jgi:putative ABC transport system ATP-binding protein